MRKLLSINHKFFSEKLSKSFSTPRPTPTNSHSIKHFHSLSKTTTHHIPNPSSLLSPHHQWRSSAITGFLSNSVLSKHFVSSSHFNRPFKTFLGSRIGFTTTRFANIKGSWSSNQRRRWSSWSRGGYSADNVVYGLIFANAAVFLLWRILPREFMYKNFTISVDNFKSGRIHTLLTSAFSHIDIEHIGSNMIGLYFFGSSIGNVFGAEYLLKLYVAGAVVGSIFYLVHHAYLANTSKRPGTFSWNPYKTPGLGASGAVNAILLLDIFLFPRKTLMFDFFIPVPAILLGIFLVGKDLMRILEGDQQISGSAHLGGATVAALAWLQLRRRLRF
ncbi:RHOMBOID-like protein 12, mitochondrial [Beta vulgaris subsp. vulgaris]|uniref:RHOMBOID-like protein 12, mitochondrial n=1 Tax=Beta vulgaris subsp. vulgaris TaxID=3555 RepID=UPI00203766E1|nr:RHOMBOID-like protein 12, mitochondrial [Beta vulgaris subsp. vulgaris]